MNNQKTIAVSGVAMLTGLAGVAAQESSPLFKIGNVEVRPHVAYSVVYDDNIFLEHKSKFLGTAGRPGRDHDFVHSFTPGLRLSAGDAGARQSGYFAANYEAAFTRFTHNSGSDSLDHNASVEFGGKLNYLHVSVEQSLESRSDADAGLASHGRVKRKTWGTVIKSTYEVREKTDLALDLAQTIGDYNGALVDSVDRSATLWLDYQLLPKVKMGAGGGVGYLQVDGNALNHNANSSYYHGLVRMAWSATEKVSIKASGGLEHRNTQELGAKDSDNFVFALGAEWKASERTTASLEASRGTRVSNAQIAQLNQETKVAANIRHSLFDRVSMNLEGGYSYSHYKATTTAADTVRDDNYFFVKPGVSYKFAERAQATVYYQYRRNDSDLATNGNDFYGNQVSLELSYRF